MKNTFTKKSILNNCFSELKQEFGRPLSRKEKKQLKILFRKSAKALENEIINGRPTEGKEPIGIFADEHVR